MFFENDFNHLIAHPKINAELLNKASIQSLCGVFDKILSTESEKKTYSEDLISKCIFLESQVFQGGKRPSFPSYKLDTNDMKNIEQYFQLIHGNLRNIIRIGINRYRELEEKKEVSLYQQKYDSLQKENDKLKSQIQQLEQLAKQHGFSDPLDDM